jgi:hypothetical protein
MFVVRFSESDFLSRILPQSLEREVARCRWVHALRLACVLQVISTELTTVHSGTDRTSQVPFAGSLSPVVGIFSRLS